MNHYTKGYTKKLGDTLRENEELKEKIAVLEAACTYDVMSMACNKFPCVGGASREKVWATVVAESLKEINTPGGE
jgi:hypothetical protein